MKYRTLSHRYADIIIPAQAQSEWSELTSAIESVTDEDIIADFEQSSATSKSVSKSINRLLDQRFTASGWLPQAPIFQDPEYTDNKWRLDFAKGFISVEVAFNHGEAIAWNLLKPVLASEYNHVKKAIQTRFGVIICATDAMKTAGGFDSAVGSFEKFERYLIPLQNPLTVPILLVGLEKPETFVIEHQAVGGRKVGRIKLL